MSLQVSSYEIQNFAFNKQAGHELSNAMASPASNGSSTSLIGNCSEFSTNDGTQLNNTMSSTPTSNGSSPSLSNLQLNICNGASASPQAFPMLSNSIATPNIPQVQPIPDTPNSTVSATTNTTPPLPTSMLPFLAPLPSASTSSATNPNLAHIPTNPTPAVNSDVEA